MLIENTKNNPADLICINTAKDITQLSKYSYNTT